jgi:hypothetical protein
LGRDNREKNKTMAGEEYLKIVDKETTKHINIIGEKDL